MRVHIGVFLICCLSLAAADSYEKQITEAVESLRKITPSNDEAELKKFNSIMDSNWTVFKKDKAISIPILTALLAKEIESAKPNDLVLLDLAWFLALLDPKADVENLLLKAYRKIDHTQRVIFLNGEQFFNFSMFLSSRQLPGFLTLLDQKFLRAEWPSFTVPKHAIVISSHAQRTHLYGVYGTQSIKHLLKILKSETDVKTRRGVLSILRRICIAECAPEIYELLTTESDHESFVNGTYIMLDNAGPQGRELYLRLVPKSLSDKTKIYFKNEQEYVKNVSYEFLLGKLKNAHGQTPNSFSERELLNETEKMIRDYGKSGVLHPLDFVESKSDKTLLIEKLMESRRRCFGRVNQHGLEDIDISNSIINALYYRK